MSTSSDVWKLAEAVVPAVIGLIGVAVGASITLAREIFLAWRRGKTDGAHLAAIVGGTLDTFISTCAAVVGDNGQADRDGESHERVHYPVFDPSKLDVQWRSIPPSLLFDIQDLPYQLQFAIGAVNNIYEYVAIPPEYEEAFEERQFQFARLGLHCVGIAERLRKHAKLSPRSELSKWDARAFFQGKVDVIEKRRAQPQSLPTLE